MRDREQEQEQEQRQKNAEKQSERKRERQFQVNSLLSCMVKRSFILFEFSAFLSHAFHLLMMPAAAAVPLRCLALFSPISELPSFVVNFFFTGDSDFIISVSANCTLKRVPLFAQTRLFDLGVRQAYAQRSEQCSRVISPDWNLAYS